MDIFEISGEEAIEILIRVFIVYLVVVLGMRLVGKREIAQLSVVDFVMMLLISNAVQNAMLGDNTSLSGGIIAALALFLINFVLRTLEYRNKRLKGLLEGEPVTLVYQGRLLEGNLKKARITEAELMSAIREHGVNEIGQVDLGVLEINGSISILSNDFSKRSSTEKNEDVKK